VVIRDIQCSLEEKDNQTTAAVENKNQYIEELQAEMASLKEEFRQKLELKDNLIRDGEAALTQSIETSELKISNLQKEVSEKDSDLQMNEERTKEEVQSLKGTIKDLQSRVAELQALEEKQKVVIRDIQCSLEEKDNQTTAAVENKNQYIEELQAEMASLKEEFRQKLELKDNLIRDGEAALTQSIDTSELKISNLQKEVSEKDSDLQMNEERTKEEVQSLKERSMDLERQLTELRGEVQRLEEQSTELCNKLSTAQEETSQAVSTKIDIICTLAQEIERLRNNSNGFVSMKKNLAEARFDRSSGPEYSTEPDMPSLEHSS